MKAIKAQQLVDHLLKEKTNLFDIKRESELDFFGNPINNNEHLEIMEKFQQDFGQDDQFQCIITTIDIQDQCISNDIKYIYIIKAEKVHTKEDQEEPLEEKKLIDFEHIITLCQYEIKSQRIVKQASLKGIFQNILALNGMRMEISSNNNFLMIYNKSINEINIINIDSFFRNGQILIRFQENIFCQDEFITPYFRVMMTENNSVQYIFKNMKENKGITSIVTIPLDKEIEFSKEEKEIKQKDAYTEFYLEGDYTVIDKFFDSIVFFQTDARGEIFYLEQNSTELKKIFTFDQAGAYYYYKVTDNVIFSINQQKIVQISFDSEFQSAFSVDLFEKKDQNDNLDPSKALLYLDDSIYFKTSDDQNIIIYEIGKQSQTLLLNKSNNINLNTFVRKIISNQFSSFNAPVYKDGMMCFKCYDGILIYDCQRIDQRLSLQKMQFINCIKQSLKYYILYLDDDYVLWVDYEEKEEEGNKVLSDRKFYVLELQTKVVYNINIPDSPKVLAVDYFYYLRDRGIFIIAYRFEYYRSTLLLYNIRSQENKVLDSGFNQYYRTILVNQDVNVKIIVHESQEVRNIQIYTLEEGLNFTQQTKQVTFDRTNSKNHIIDNKYSIIFEEKKSLMTICDLEGNILHTLSIDYKNQPLHFSASGLLFYLIDYNTNSLVSYDLKNKKPLMTKELQCGFPLQQYFFQIKFFKQFMLLFQHRKKTSIENDYNHGYQFVNSAFAREQYDVSRNGSIFVYNKCLDLIIKINVGNIFDNYMPSNSLNSKQFQLLHKNNLSYLKYTSFSENPLNFQNDVRIFMNLIPHSNYYEYDDTLGECKIFFKDNSQQILLSAFKFSYSSEDFNKHYQLLNKTNTEKIQVIKESDILDLTINSTNFYPYLDTFLHSIALSPQVLYEFVKKFQFIDLDKTFFMFKNNYNQTALEIAAENNQTQCMIMILDLIVRFQEKPEYNYLVDKALCNLIKQKIDLKEYFQSKLPVIQITHDAYPVLHTDARRKIYGCQYDTFFQILNKEAYNEIIGKDCVQKSSDNLSFSESRHQDLSQVEDKQAIEYFIINIPETLTIDKSKLMRTLSQTDRIDLFDNICIQTVIDYKWEKYTFNVFFKQFLIYLVFLFTFITDLYLTVSHVQNVFEEDTLNTIYYVQIGLKMVCTLILLYFITYEIKSAMIQTKEYFADPWNFFDFLIVAVYIPTSLCDLLDVYPAYQRILYCFMLILAFVKLNFFLRIFEGFSFLVSMMLGVFSDLKYFIGFFIFVIAEVSLLFTILVDNSEIYASLGLFGYYFMSFRTSLGDFDLDNFNDQSELGIQIFRWIIWLVAVFILNVVFMNFIIAVISESYEKVMQKLIAQSYKVKVDMIVEREYHFTQEDYNNPEYFPKFLILRRPAQSDEQELQEWQGFVKDIKVSMAKNFTRTKTEIQYKLDMVQRDNHIIERKIQEKLENNSQQIIDLQGALKSLNDQIKEIRDQQVQIKDQQIQREERQDKTMNLIQEQTLQLLSLLQPKVKQEEVKQEEEMKQEDKQEQ